MFLESSMNARKEGNFLVASMSVRKVGNVLVSSINVRKGKNIFLVVSTSVREVGIVSRVIYECQTLTKFF
jgi:hypothetical protein